MEPLTDNLHELSAGQLMQLVLDKHEESVALQRRHERICQEHKQQMGVMSSMVDKMKQIFSAAVKKVSSKDAA